MIINLKLKTSKTKDWKFLVYLYTDGRSYVIVVSTVTGNA